jgi:hypothetical protein
LVKLAAQVGREQVPLQQHWHIPQQVYLCLVVKEVALVAQHQQLVLVLRLSQAHWDKIFILQYLLVQLRQVLRLLEEELLV